MKRQTEKKPEPVAAPRKRRSQQERRETTRAQLINAAIDCLVDLGFSGTTLTAITERAGVTMGAVQHHFGSRNDLFVALMNEISVQLSAFVSDERIQDRPVRERIQEACDRYWGVINSRHFIAAMKIMLTTTEDSEFNLKIYRILSDAQATVDTQWAETFADTNLSGTELVTLRRVTISALRGFALLQVQRGSDRDWIEERRLLTQMLTSALSSD